MIKVLLNVLLIYFSLYFFYNFFVGKTQLFLMPRHQRGIYGLVSVNYDYFFFSLFF